ncbi:MAG: hypothetical protein Q4P32_06830 [Micrococcales bacterium]|nr:hypothetical protein [Micrococcales bacterium]
MPGESGTAGSRGVASAGAGRHRPGRKAGSLVVMHRGHLVIYLERGGRTLLSWSDDPGVLGLVAEALAGCVRVGTVGALTVQRINGHKALGSAHPVVNALTAAGFHTTPNGLRLRR